MSCVFLEGNKSSKFFPIKLEVAQGYTLLPKLFFIIINNLLCEIE